MVDTTHQLVDSLSNTARIQRQYASLILISRAHSDSFNLLKQVAIIDAIIDKNHQNCNVNKISQKIDATQCSILTIEQNILVAAKQLKKLQSASHLYFNEVQLYEQKLCEYNKNIAEYASKCIYLSDNVIPNCREIISKQKVRCN